MEQSAMMDASRESRDDTPQSPRNPWEDSDDRLIAHLSQLDPREQIAMQIGWLRALYEHGARDRNHRDVLHNETLAALRGEFDRHSIFEAEVRRAQEHLTHALTTLASAVTESRGTMDRLAAKIDADAAERDRREGILIAEMGARAQHDSHQDIDLADIAEKTGQHDIALARVQAAQIESAKAKGIRQGGGGVGLLVVVVEIVRLLNAHWPW